MNLNLFTNYATSVHTFSLSFWNLRIYLIYSNLFYNVIFTFLGLLTLLNFLNLLYILVLHFPCHPRTGIPCATAWRSAACVATRGIHGPCAVLQRWMGGRRSKTGGKMWSWKQMPIANHWRSIRMLCQVTIFVFEYVREMVKVDWLLTFWNEIWISEAF